MGSRKEWEPQGGWTDLERAETLPTTLHPTDPGLRVATAVGFASLA